MFAKTFTEAVTRWHREQRPRAGESWYAVHYRSGWLIERMNFRESVELLRQGLDVRAVDPKDRGRRKRKRLAETGHSQGSSAQQHAAAPGPPTEGATEPPPPAPTASVPPESPPP